VRPRSAEASLKANQLAPSLVPSLVNSVTDHRYLYMGKSRLSASDNHYYIAIVYAIDAPKRRLIEACDWGGGCCRFTIFRAPESAVFFTADTDHVAAKPHG